MDRNYSVVRLDKARSEPYTISFKRQKAAPLAGKSEGLITNMVDLIKMHSIVVDEHW